MRIERDQPIITLVNPPAFEGGGIKGRITPDVYSEVPIEPVGLAHIAGALKAEGYDNVSIIDKRFDRKSNGNFTDEDWNLMHRSSVLGIGAMLRSTTTSLSLIQKLLDYDPNKIIPVGGFGPEFEEERWLEGKPGNNIIIVRGDGEDAIRELMQANMNPEGIKGVTYKRDGQIIRNKNRPLLTEDQLSNLPMPWYPDYIRQNRKTHAVNESRGCPSKCGFCQVTKRYDGTYRRKSDDRIIAEINDGKKRENVFFCGDNFAPRSRREDTKKFVKRLVSEGLNRNYSAQIDASFTEDMELVKLCRKAGFLIFFQGKESISNNELRNVHKPFTAEKSINSTETLRDMGFFVFDNFILGLPGQTHESVAELKEYLLKKNRANAGMILLLVPLPGTETGMQKDFFPFVKEDTNLINGNYQVTTPPEGFTCCEQQNELWNLYSAFYSNGHLLKTLLEDFKQFILDYKKPGRTLKLIALDLFAHGYEKKTVASMKTDAYTKKFMANLGGMDQEIARGETVVFDASNLK